MYDALLLVSFGGPDGPEDVIPFLENVLQGRNVPRERMFEVAEHYQQFGGKSPINEQNRLLIAALEHELSTYGPQLRVYWGNRNWHPLLADTLRRMANDGVRRAAAFVTSAFSSYSGCRQYREDIARAQQEVGPTAPQVDKLRVFFNHPGFIEPMIERTREALAQLPADRRDSALLVFTAHSIPQAMADGCRYEAQLRDACALVAAEIGREASSLSLGESRDVSSLSLRERAGVRAPWHLVYQSRSGPPQQRWLEPDICDFLREQHARRPFRDVIIVPIGFISDHLEVVYDLDTAACAVCDELGVNMLRAATVGTHPRFIRMIRELLAERMSGAPRLALGTLGPNDDVCPEDCCMYNPRPPAGAGRPA